MCRCQTLYLTVPNNGKMGGHTEENGGKGQTL